VSGGKYMKKKIIFSISISFMIIVSNIAISPCSSEVVWSENFDDGDMEGWTVTQGNFTVINGYLESVAKEKLQTPFGSAGGSDHDLLSCCFTQSKVAVGTWSFDIYFNCSAERPEIAVEFMTKKQTKWGPGMPLGAEAYGKTYGIYAGYDTAGYYELYTAPYFPGVIEIKLYPTGPGLKRKEWHHIDVTRDEAGQIRLYVDGILGIDIVDIQVTESQYFGIMLEYSHRGKSYIDNIVVSDTIDIHPSEDETTKSNALELPTKLAIVGIFVAALIIWSIKRSN
jgi:hypothetical protein